MGFEPIAGSAYWQQTAAWTEPFINIQHADKPLADGTWIITNR